MQVQAVQRMFGWCCEQTRVPNEQYVLLRGSLSSSSARQPFHASPSQLNALLPHHPTPFRMLLLSPYDQLKTTAQLSATPYRDPAFPPTPASLGPVPGRPLAWRRMPALVEGPLAAETPLAKVLRLKSDDSYLLASLCALLHATQGKLVRDVLGGELELSPEGIYRLALCNRGRSQLLLLDDHLPVFAENPQRTAFCKLTPGLPWVCLFEKAWAKLCGSYSRTQLGYAHDVLATFSLAPCLYHPIPLLFTHPHQDQLWTTLQHAQQYRLPVACGSRKNFTCRGIRPNKTYCLLSTSTTTSPTSHSRRVTLLGQPAEPCPCCLEHEQSNTFSLDLVEFMRNFSLLDIAHLRPTFNSYFYPCTLARRPTCYQFTLQEDSEVYFTLHRGENNEDVLLLLVEEREGEVEMLQGKRERVFADVSLHCERLKPGRYVLYCEGGKEGEGLLRVYTPNILQLRQLQQERTPFLEHLFLSQAKKGEMRPFGSDPSDWCGCGLTLELGWGYLVVQLGPTSKLTCSVQYDTDRLLNEGFRVINRTAEHYRRDVKAGQCEVLLFEPTPQNEAVSFPPAALSLTFSV